jgi:hypothetical protein
MLRDGAYGLRLSLPGVLRFAFGWYGLLPPFGRHVLYIGMENTRRFRRYTALWVLSLIPDWYFLVGL